MKSDNVTVMACTKGSEVPIHSCQTVLPHTLSCIRHLQLKDGLGTSEACLSEELVHFFCTIYKHYAIFEHNSPRTNLHDYITENPSCGFKAVKDISLT